MWSFGKIARFVAVLTLMFGVLVIASPYANGSNNADEHSMPCPPPCSEHDNMSDHADGVACQLCLSCISLRNDCHTADLQPVVASLDVPILSTPAVYDHLIGFDPLPPRL